MTRPHIDPPPLTETLAWLKIPHCTCGYEWKGYGILYGISMGKGWVRMDTEPDCKHHGRKS